MPVQTIRRDNIDKICEAINKRLSAFEPKLNLKCEATTARFNQHNATIKLVVSVIDGETQMPITPERQMFMLVAKEYGLSQKLLDRPFYIGNGTNAKIIGYKLRAPIKKFVLLDDAKCRRVCDFMTLKRLLLADKRVSKFVINPDRIPNVAMLEGRTPEFPEQILKQAQERAAKRAKVNENKRRKATPAETNEIDDIVVV